MAETWVINESPMLSDFDATINFTSGNIIVPLFYKRIRCYKGSGPRAIFYTEQGFQAEEFAVYDSEWRDQAYRTVTFETAPTGDLLTWLQANAVKQSSITDLTGYTWTCSSIICGAGYGRFGESAEKLQFLVNGTGRGEVETDPFNTFAVGYTSNFDQGFIARANIVTLWPSLPQRLYVGDEVYFISGTDLTNTELITWLEANGTLTPPPAGYSVIYHANGGTPIPENLTGQTSLPSPLPTLTKTHYTFAGWYLNSTFTTPAVAGATISGDVNLYAKFTRSDVTLDLSTIELSEGTHNIQIKLSDNEQIKADSELSNAVIYTVEPLGETWVINENPNVMDDLYFDDIAFTTGGIEFGFIHIVMLRYPGMRPQRGIDYTIPAYGLFDGWYDQAYRTLYFPIPPTGDLRTWLDANAIKQ